MMALFAHDRIIRPCIGDLLVLILLYCFVQSFLNTPVFATAIPVLLFCYMVEILQYFKIINILGLQNSLPASVVLGTSFEWIGLVAYTVGIEIVFIAEKVFGHGVYVQKEEE